MVKYKDYYATLGVDRKASDKEIKSAYRGLARQYHPDTNQGDPKAEERFKEITEAYEVLKDPEKRKRYDLLGANWKAGADFKPPPGFSDFQFDFGNFGGFRSAGGSSGPTPFSDFFETLFGQTFGNASSNASRGGFSTGRRPAPSEFEIELSIEEMAKGTTRNIQITHPGAKGKTLQVKIPAGVRPGSKVRVPAQAAPSPSGASSGDIFLKVKTKPHPIFSIEGDNLISELVISPAQAVLGGEVTVQTLDGQVKVNIPAGSQNSRMLRLRERGLPKLKQSTRSDHLVRLKVETPASVSAAEKVLYEQLLKFEQEKNKKAVTP